MLFKLISNGNVLNSSKYVRSEFQVLTGPPGWTLLTRYLDIDRIVETSERNILQPATGSRDIVEVSLVVKLPTVSKVQSVVYTGCTYIVNHLKFQFRR